MGSAGIDPNSYQNMHLAIEVSKEAPPKEDADDGKEKEDAAKDDTGAKEDESKEWRIMYSGESNTIVIACGQF